MPDIGLGIRLSASGAGAVRAELSGVTGSVERMGDVTGDVMSRLRGIFAGVGFAVLAKEFVQAADTMALTSARLKLATSSAEEFAEAQAELFKLAQANNLGIKEATELYTRLSGPIKSLGGTTREVVAITDAFAKSLRIGGASAQEASAATLQFAQAMGSGKLAGDEFRSIAEASPRFMKALADGLNVPIGSLKQMASEGKLTADVVGNALVKSLGKLTAEAQSLPDTVGGAMQRLGNEALAAVDNVNKLTGATSSLSDFVGGVANLVGVLSRAFSNGLAQSSQQASGSIDLVGLALGTFGTILETIIVMAANVGYVFKTIGTEIGGMAAQAVAFFSGNFAQVGEIRKAMVEDAAASRQAVDNFSASVVGSTAKVLAIRDAVKSHSVSVSDNNAEMAKLSRQQEEAGSGYKKLAAAAAAAAEQAKKEAAAYATLLESYNKLGTATASKLNQQQLEIEGGRKLNAAEEDYVKVMADVSSGKVKMNDLIKTGTLAKLQDNLALAAAADALKEEAKWLADSAKESEKYTESVQKRLEGLLAETDKQREANDAMGMSKEALADLKAAKLEDLAVSADRRAQLLDEIDWSGQLGDQQRKLAAAYRAAAGEAQRGAHLTAAQDAASEWKKTTDSIGQGLTDSLFRAFESGKGFFTTLWDGIKNLFKTTVLKMMMQPVQAGINGMVGGVMSGLTGTASAAGSGGGGASGLLSNLGSIGTLLGTAGTTLGTGFAAGMAGTLGGAGAATFGAGASLAGAGVGAGSAVGAAGGMGMMAGAAMPYIAAAMALYAAYKALKHKVTPHMGSAVGVGADGVATTLAGDSSQILNNYNADTDTALRAMGGASVGSLNSLSKAFGGTGGFGAEFKFAADGKDQSIGSALFNRNGTALASGVGSTSQFAFYDKDRETAFTAFTADVAAATRAALDGVALPTWAREQFAKLGSGSTIEQFAALADAVTATQEALRGLQTEVSPLGGVFARVAGLSGDALKQLTDFAGGIEAFGTQVGTYVKNYYSADEQAALAAASLQRVLADSGVDLGALTTRESFRALVDATDVGTEAGRKQLSALLGASESFAGLADYLAEQGGTLAELAALAPAVGALGSLTADAGVATADGLAVLDTSVITSGANVVAAINELRASTEAGHAASVAATQAMNRLLESWDDGGALVTTDGTGGGGS